MDFDSECEGLAPLSSPFKAVLKGREAVDLFVYSRQGTLDVIQVSILLVSARDSHP